MELSVIKNEDLSCFCRDLKNRVHVFSFDLDMEEKHIRILRRNLSEEEQKRADRFKFEKHRNRFTVSHSILRILLAHYLDINPASIQYRYSEKGKPELEANGNFIPLYFNMSHSGKKAIFAFSGDVPVGIDIEYIKPFQDVERIAKRFFSKAEYDALNLLEPPKRLIAFFKLWTLKEAYLKATGKGIGALESIEVVFYDGRFENRLKKRFEDEPIKGWTFFSFDPAESFISSLAVKTEIIKTFQFFPHISLIKET